ncbi:unnamed protein product [Symbiodinium natans]|uniref:Tyr recombinase domain-containing protein n=1 Tax=Symbiodinium natans TaxID=878477 RepID=A0A812RLK8_9DINO|nr:unnamed protein product [Symbiodinium natans]
MCSFLRTLAVSVVRLASDTPGSGLRLPATAGRLNQLREQLGELGHVPYAGSGRRFDGVRRERAFTATQALPVVSSRLSLPEHVQNFDPTPYLSPTFRHVYESPGDFLKAEEEMPPPIRVRGTASRQELLKVFERWDKLGRLYICHEKEVSPLDRCEIFAVAKDVDRDRQILHRKRRNMRERHLVGASKDLPHGVLLCQLPLEDKYVCVCSVDDVKDFYHAYSASTERAKSSPVGPSFRASEVAHLGAFKDAIREGRLHVMSRVACCFRGLGMGDHAAVDIAQESHTNLLKAYGGLVEGEVLRYRNPLPDPPSKFYEGIMIDDHLGIQLLERRSSLRATLDQAGRDEEAFASAEQAYAEANLESHPKKRQRRVLNAKVWGIEIEGLRGLVGPVRSRLLALATLTARAAAPGPVDQQVLEGLCGLWSFSAQFRRPMFSFMYAMYHQQGPGRADEPFRLTREARHELSLLACLAPLCLTDLRAIPDDFLYCVDASPSGAGVCRTKVGRVASREFWRRGDKLGYRMPLLSKLSASLIGSGWGEEAVESMLHASEPESWDPEEDGETPHSAVTALVEGFLRRALRGGGSHFPVPTPLADAPFDFLEVPLVGPAAYHVLVSPRPQVEAGQGFVGEQRAFGVMRLLEPWTFLLSRGAITKADMIPATADSKAFEELGWVGEDFDEAPYVLAKNLYIAGLHLPTWSIRAIRLDLLQRLETWLLTKGPGETLEDMARHHIAVLSEWLEEYMIDLFVNKHSRRDAAETLNAVGQKYGWLKSSLASAWSLVRTWEGLEPSEHHPPLPVQVLRALATTALAWSWPRVAVLLVLGFFGLLRPSEAIGLRRQDVSLPSDHFERDVLFIRVGSPKTRHRGARSQHVRVDEPGVAAWVDSLVGQMPLWRRLWSGSWAAFRRRFELLQLEVLGARFFLPSSLRPGGATFLFRLWDENLTRVQWRGRWRSFRMLEIFVQELGADQGKWCEKLSGRTVLAELAEDQGKWCEKLSGRTVLAELAEARG